jgi:hypothetical protein
MTVIDCTEDAVPVCLPHPSLIQERIDCAWASYNRQLDRLDTIQDDLIPHLHVRTGTEIFAEAFGCPVHRPEDDMPFARPLIHSASELAGLKQPTIDCPSLTQVFDIADAPYQRGGSQALLKMADIQSPMDISALIWDKASFYIAILMEPDAVKALSQMVTQLLCDFLDEWFSRYGSAFIAHYPFYYMDHGITLSEDEIGDVNSDIFLEFFLPELVYLSRRSGQIGIHCCANSRHQWDNLKQIPNLRLLNLVQPPDVLTEAYTVFESHCAQFHSWQGEGSYSDRLRMTSQKAHAVFEFSADSWNEAAALSDSIASARNAMPA